MADVRNAVTQALQTAGGTATHSELVAALEANGRGYAAQHLRSLKAEGVITSRVRVVQQGEKPVLYYSLPAQGGA